jgi:opacity protein-like surface antigen
MITTLPYLGDNKMKLITKLLLVAVLGAFSLPSLADFYIGGKTGVLDPDNNDFDADNDNPLALQLGFTFGPFAIQGEAYSSESEVENSGFDADLDVLAVYGVFRTPGFIYFMAKGGLVDGEVSAPGFNQDDTALSYGIGAGFNLADFIFIEAEYTLFDVEDTDFDFFGVSANIKF